MENLSMDIENQKVKFVDRSDFDEGKSKQQVIKIQKAEDEDRRQREPELEDLMSRLNENTDKKEKVEEFIKNNCSEPIENVNQIVPFKDLVEMLVKGAGSEGKEDVKKSILEGNVKDKRIYKLSVYKDLIEEGFILPSDVRTYYDSANREPVYHLGIDYNVKGGMEVKSIYKGKVVKSGWDGGLGHKVVIEHEMDDGTKFYSLYGHLGSKDLPKIGDEVGIRTKIGEVGKEFSEENGNWNSHLHFQIMESVDSPKGYSKHEGIGNYDVLKAFGK